MERTLTEFIGRIYLLTVCPIAGIEEMKFVRIGRTGKLYDLAMGNDVIIPFAPCSRQVVLKVHIQSPRSLNGRKKIDRDTVEDPRSCGEIFRCVC